MPFKNNEKAKKWREENKERYRPYHRSYKRRWRKTPEAKAYKRMYSLKTRYGITIEAYETLLTQQGGRCAICECEQVRRRLHVDHCHSTGVVRGLLCDTCNLGLGIFQDDPRLLKRAIAYLKPKRKAA